MHVSLKFFSSALFILLLSASLASAQTGAINADPDFDKYDADPNGPWQTFKIGAVGPRVWHSPKGGEGWPGGPALSLTRETPYDGGVYQVVNVTPGKGYHFEVAWAAVRYSGGTVPNDIGKTGRLIGIDPYGGTNAAASTVQWSPELRDGRHFQTPELLLFITIGPPNYMCLMKAGTLSRLTRLTWIYEKYSLINHMMSQLPYL